MSILGFLKKEHTHSEKSFDQKLSEFLTKSLRKEYEPQKKRKAALCHESVKRVINFETDAEGTDKDCIIIWKSQTFNTFRFAKGHFSVTGKECGTIEPRDILEKDIESCTHRMPLALCYGCRPEIVNIAGLSNNENIDAFLATGLDCNLPVVVAECFTQDLEIPAECDLVLEGYIQKSDETRSFHVTCITKRLS